MEDEMLKKKSLNTTKVYNAAWEKLPIFKGWLTNGNKGALYGRCIACDRYLRAQRNDIYKHSQSMLHKKNMTRAGMKAAKGPYPFKKVGSPRVHKPSTQSKIAEAEANPENEDFSDSGTEYLVESLNENELYNTETLEENEDQEEFDAFEEVEMEDPNQSKSSTKIPQIFSEEECDIFGAFITNEMKALDPEKRKIFKKKVLKTLLELGDD